MGDYTNMSYYYDVIMTSGYYDYEKIVDSLLNGQTGQRVLEIGCGTGLILEELAKRQSQSTIAGIDLTQAMLNIAQERLKPFGNVSLSQQNVCSLDLPQQHDLAFSYGGVWYFVVDGDKEPFMVSHIPDHEANQLGLARVAQYIAKGGTLLLGIQGPHHDYAKPIANGMVYSQKIEPSAHGFTKHYFLNDGETRLMAQTIDYRTYSFAQALEMMGVNGIEYAPQENRGHLFLGFKKT